jgi:ribosomal protein L16/L10AE
MGRPVFNVELTEDELHAIEKALAHANANERDMKILLRVFYNQDVAKAARTAWNKAGQKLREITIARKTESDE